MNTKLAESSVEERIKSAAEAAAAQSRGSGYGTGFAKLDSQPTYRLVFDAIERLILNGELKVGDILPIETELASQFGINRSTLREGIRLLEEGGLVERRSAKRLYVRLPHMTELSSRASRALKLHQVTFSELWEASLATEPAIARYAAQRISKDEIELIEQNLVEMQEAGDDYEKVVRLDIKFHDIIAQASRNRALVLAREPISLLFLPAGRAILPRLRTEKRVVDAHRELLHALRNHLPDEAESWMRRHIEDFRRGFEKTGLSMGQALDSVS